MTSHRNLFVLLALIAAGCGDGSSGGASRAAAPLSLALTGRIVDAPAGTVVHLLAAGEVAPDAGLLAHAAGIVDTLDVGPLGDFEVALEPGAAAPAQVLVSAPGRALLRAPFEALATGNVALAPEAVIVVRVVSDDGAPEVDAMAIVLDQDGRPVPIPPETLASGVDGELRATRLPEGDYTLGIGSADGKRHALLSVSLPAGAVASHTVTLTEEPEAARRWVEVIAGRDATLESGE